MLKELRNVKQIRGEPERRWFFCHDMDLVVWTNASHGICGFQLAYDKCRDEHSISWHIDHGFAHYAVDDGEQRSGANNTPFLHADGPFKRDRVLEQFRAISLGVPEDIAAFVESRLMDVNEATPPASGETNPFRQLETGKSGQT